MLTCLFSGNLLSYVSRGRATASTPVESVMFNFTKIKEFVTDPSEIGSVRPAAGVRKKRYDEITLDTPLSALSKFCKSCRCSLNSEPSLTAYS